MGTHGFLYLALIVSLFLICLPVPSPGQALYSYVDDSGVRVFTNIPPKGQIYDLKVTGAHASMTAPQAAESSNCATRYDPIIEKYAAQYRLDPSLICSMISTESGFNSRAVSVKGARGLMQLMPETAARLGVRDLFDPEENIRAGTRHMRSLMDAFNNDLRLSLAAYNAGENLVQRVGRIPNIKETRDYVRSITQKYSKRDSSPQATPSSRPPSTYRYFDQNGVLHLTNAPPASNSEVFTSLLPGSSQFHQ